MRGTSTLLSNDEVAASVRAYPDRFVGVASVDLRHDFPLYAECIEIGVPIPTPAALSWRKRRLASGSSSSVSTSRGNRPGRIIG